jgi:hypothetical protein
VFEFSMPVSAEKSPKPPEKPKNALLTPLDGIFSEIEPLKSGAWRE